MNETLKVFWLGLKANRKTLVRAVRNVLIAAFSMILYAKIITVYPSVFGLTVLIATFLLVVYAMYRSLGGEEIMKSGQREKEKRSE